MKKIILLFSLITSLSYSQNLLVNIESVVPDTFAAGDSVHIYMAYNYCYPTCANQNCKIQYTANGWTTNWYAYNNTFEHLDSIEHRTFYAPSFPTGVDCAYIGYKIPTGTPLGSQIIEATGDNFEFPVFVSSVSGISHLNPNYKLVKTEYYTLDGVNISEPINGINVLLKCYSDGYIERTKVFISSN